MAPTTVRFGGSSTITGQLTNAAAGTTVTLEQSPSPFSAFTAVGTPVATDAAGNYSFTVNPGLHTHYRVVAQSAPPVTSAEVTVLVVYAVRLKVSDSKVRRGQRVRFKGKVAPAHDGRKVKIQRRSSAGFKNGREGRPACRQGRRLQVRQAHPHHPEGHLPRPGRG